MKKTMNANRYCARLITAVLTAMILALGLLPSPVSAAGSPIYSPEEQFSDRDLKQTADTESAVVHTVEDGNEISITEEGIYVLTGTARNATVYVEAGEKDKVQLVLDDLSIINDDFPCIYVKTADKVFLTVSSDSSLTVTGAFRSDGDKSTGAVILSRQDLVLNGTASLTVSSSQNGIVCKDDLKITGGTWMVNAKAKAIGANDSIRIAGGTLVLNAGTDGLHAENDDDDTLGYVYIADGSLTVTAGDDGIHALSVVQIDGGDLSIRAAEGIEATYIQINGGTISVDASDDGINAASKSRSLQATVEINGGGITVAMGQGDTDGIDSNGDIIVTGGTVNVTGNSTFDYDGTASFTGGTIIVNGQQVSSIPNQMMGGRGVQGGQNGWDGQNQNGWDVQGSRGGQSQGSPDARTGPTTGQEHGRQGGW